METTQCGGSTVLVVATIDCRGDFTIVATLDTHDDAAVIAGRLGRFTSYALERSADSAAVRIRVEVHDATISDMSDYYDAVNRCLEPTDGTPTG